MKFQISNWLILALFAVVAPPGKAWSQTKAFKIDADHSVDAFYEDVLNLPDRVAKAKSVALDNELEPSEEGKDADFRNNPLLLNGKPLEYADFSPFSKGILTVVKGDPASPAGVGIPFRVYLRRHGEAVCRGLSDPRREVMSVEISEVMKQARDGDHLIVVPARKQDWKAKRILLVFGGC